MDKAVSVKNEAEIQAKLQAELHKALPFLPVNIRLERNIHLKLGHKQISIDGLSPNDKTRGRYDMLVFVDNAPLLLAELKAPDVDLTSDDIEQGRSYAALAQVPLFFVSNGRTTTLRFTSNKEEIGDSAKKLSEILDRAASLAAADEDSAIRTILGCSAPSWKRILGEWTEKTLQDLTGDAKQLRRPLVKGFVLARAATIAIEKGILEGKEVIVVHGPPLFGVTNVLAQVARISSLGPALYVEAHTGTDILQWIANRLTKEIGISITKEGLRHWFNVTRGLLKIIIIVDGMPRQDTLDELIDWARGGHIQLVIGTSSEVYRKARSLPGRNQDSPLGLAATPVRISHLSDAEFEDLSEIYYNAYGAVFSKGAEIASHLRLVSTHRIIAASLPPKEAAPVGAGLVIPAIFGPDSLERYNSAFVAGPQQKHHFQKLANGYLKEVEARISEPDWISGTWGFPSVSAQFAEKAFLPEDLKSLEEQGFLSWASTANDETRLLIRVEMVFAHYIAQKWCEDLCTINKPHSIERRLEDLVRNASVIPNGLIALAAAIARAGNRRADILSTAVKYLIHRPPVKTRLRTGTKLKLLTKGRDITLHFGEGMDEETIANPFHWLTLSYLAFYLMAEDGGDTPTMNTRIFGTIGGYDHVLLQPSHVSLGEHKPIPFHDIAGQGSFLAFEAGIIEPLTQAMINYATFFPAEFNALSEYALHTNNAHLIRRVHFVAAHLSGAVEKSLSEIAQTVAKKSYEWWVDFLGKSLNLPTDFIEEFRKQKAENSVPSNQEKAD